MHPIGRDVGSQFHPATDRVRPPLKGRMKRIRFSEEQIITVFHEHEGGWKGRTGGATLYQLKAIRRGGIVPPVMVDAR